MVVYHGILDGGCNGLSLCSLCWQSVLCKASVLLTGEPTAEWQHLSEKGPHRLLGLGTWSFIGGTGLRGYGTF